MKTTLNHNMSICMYCGKQEPNTTLTMAEHILACEKRPELKLLTRIRILEDTGDALLRTIHSVVKALAEIEGMRSKSWQIHTIAKEKWEEAKQITPEGLENFVNGQEEEENS